MRWGVEKPCTLDLAGFIDRNAQRVADAVRVVGQQARNSGVQELCSTRIAIFSSTARGGRYECPDEIARR